MYLKFSTQVGSQFGPTFAVEIKSVRLRATMGTEVFVDIKHLDGEEERLILDRHGQCFVTLKMKRSTYLASLDMTTDHPACELVSKDVMHARIGRGGILGPNRLYEYADQKSP